MSVAINFATLRRKVRQDWPWALVFTLIAVAAWHAFDFPDDLDVEFPKISRPTFSAHPPPAIRLAEPGDTLDRIAIYVSSIALVISVAGICRESNHRAWTAALAISAAAFWYASNPGPAFDGWHGMGWASAFDPSTPITLRIGLATTGLALLGLTTWGLWPLRNQAIRTFEFARERRVTGLILAALVLTSLRWVGLNHIEPFGYWPRCAFVSALVLFSAVLLRVSTPQVTARRTRFRLLTVGSALWLGFVFTGIWLTWYQRPLERLRTVVPGRIYMSAMPTASGLEIAQNRHHFKTIINLFPEDTAFRSPRLGEEVRFAKKHGIAYYGSPSEVAKSNEFLDLTLKLARDPEAWPILVHCHACMDRTPAWVGIYRYVVEGWKLDDVLRFIEGHRGYRPKASVTLLYNRVLPRLASERFAQDPTGALLRKCAEGTTDPYYAQLEEELNRANPTESSRVERESSAVTTGRLPSLTPRR